MLPLPLSPILLLYCIADSSTDNRKLDFTCCDIEAEIIDDTQGVRVQQLWNLYYHVFIDNETFKLLVAETRKLLDHSKSLTDWEQGPYASLVRFGDTTTFANVVRLWELYAVDSTDKTKYKEVQDSLKSQWNVAGSYKNDVIKDGCVLTGLRSVAPLLVEGSSNISKQYKTFWASGTYFEDKKVIKKHNIANPMFACHRNGLILHYGTDPLWGFHLALGYATLSADSPLRAPDTVPSSGKAIPIALRSAMTQLESWCKAFRNAIHKVTIRYINSDAIAFCHVLQHHRTYDETRTANWYRSSWNYSAFVLDSTDYGESGHAPTSFDVIDTSNLVDHLDSLNVMIATVSLLKSKPSSNIRTEMLLPRELTVAESAETLLCGDLPTMALLLGLKPLQYWTNTTATWHISEFVLEKFPNSDVIGHALS